MPRYAAFLRGVMPTNANMPQLKKCFERAGFTEVKTVLSSGNVAFGARPTSKETLQRRIEAAMKQDLGNAFLTIVRPVDRLREILAADPYRAFRLPPAAKRVVTFLRDEAPGKLEMPIEVDGARILLVDGNEAFSAYVPGARGPTFMTLIEKTFGKEVTTRTWDTVKKVASA
jgi:uncharacterized protein (DUF1697 family)